VVAILATRRQTREVADIVRLIPVVSVRLDILRPQNAGWCEIYTFKLPVKANACNNM